MSIWTLTLLDSRPLAHGTQAFRFSRPAGFEFAPGQALNLMLTAAGRTMQGVDAVHAFSLVSAPHEDFLDLATRMRDSMFKQVLGGMQAGDQAQVTSAFGGSLGLHPDAQRAAVMLAGGIGITPFISLLRDAKHKGNSQPLRLLYSNRTPQEAAYLDELKELEQQLPDFCLHAFMTRVQPGNADWQGPVGYLDEARIRQLTAGLPHPVYYLSGPPAFVEGMRDLLEALDVTDGDIHSETFGGY